MEKGIENLIKIKERLVNEIVNTMTYYDDCIPKELSSHVRQCFRILTGSTKVSYEIDSEIKKFVKDVRCNRDKAYNMLSGKGEFKDD